MIGDEDITAAVHRNACRSAEAAAQRNDLSVAARGDDLLYRIVTGIGDEDVAAGVYRDALRAVEALPSGTTVA